MVNQIGAECKNLTISSGGSVTISDASYSLNADSLTNEGILIISAEIFT